MSNSVRNGIIWVGLSIPQGKIEKGGAKKGDPIYLPDQDINCDGKIDIYDVVIACAHYGGKYP
jgi:hypothetical protein